MLRQYPPGAGVAGHLRFFYACAVQSACHIPGAQDTRGQQGRKGVGGLPCTLLCRVHAEGIEGGGGQRDRRPDTLQPGTRGRAR